MGASFWVICMINSSKIRKLLFVLLCLAIISYPPVSLVVRWGLRAMRRARQRHASGQASSSSGSSRSKWEKATGRLSREWRTLGADPFSNESWPNFRLLQYAKDETPKDSPFLVFRMGEFAHYAQRKLILYLDPRMIDIYRTKGKEATHQALLDLGVSYIYTPPYVEPVISRTAIRHILAAPELCELIDQSENGYRLFKLMKEKRAVSREPHAISNSDFSSADESDGNGPKDWSLFSYLHGYGARNWSLQKDDEGKPCLTVVNDAMADTYLFSGTGQMRAIPAENTTDSSAGPRIDPDATYLFTTKIRGAGKLMIALRGFEADGEQMVPMPLWIGLLNAGYEEVSFLFKPCRDTARYRLIFCLMGKGRVTIQGVEIERLRFDDK